MRHAPLPLIFALLCSACASTPLPKGSTARVAVFRPSNNLSRARQQEVQGLFALSARLVSTAPRLTAVPVELNARALTRALRRATRRCRTRRCRGEARQRLLGASHALEVKVSRRRRRCRVETRLYRFTHAKAQLEASRTAACGDGALAGAVTGALCEILSSSHATTRTECLAEGEIFWLDRMARELLSERLKLQRAKVAERILALKGAYLRIAREGTPRRGVIAHCRAAWLYDELAHHMTPKGAKPTGDAAAFRAQAAILYQGCITQAQRLGLHAPAAAHERLKQLQTQ